MREDIKNALEVLRKGGVILYPTDTIWGIGCDPTHAVAVDRIYSIKQRSDAKSMLVLMDTPNRLYQYVSEIPDIAWELIDVANKPLTIIYPGAKNLPANLLAEDGSIGIRIVQDDFCRQLIQQFKKPIVSTSANISGEPPPQNYHEIADDIFQHVDYVVQHRQDEQQTATPSQIIKLGLSGEIQIIRK